MIKQINALPLIVAFELSEEGDQDQYQVDVFQELVYHSNL